MFDRARLSSFLGCTCGGMVFILLILLFMIFESARVEVTWPFRVSVTLELGGLSERHEVREVARTLIARSTMVITSSEPYW